ncbi:DUF7144 family membrane protein [Nocardia carnea]|uniref:DUF7144 family membrane protein n=1 Tax=Nocardia carnea TaxID=37328 RepID=UPI00245380F8|nr:hypothetical protein [Nocardia carnea]
MATYGTESGRPPVKRRVAAVASIAAAVLLLTVGVLSILAGVSAVAADELFVAGPNYILQFSTTTWGWVHIALGALLALAALGLMTGALWARITAVFLAALSIVANFLWAPYYPWWSIVVIALDVVIIWAVSTWRPEQR